MSGIEFIQFVPGTVIEWCGIKFMVVKNNGSNGVVREINKDSSFGNLINRFYWQKGGIKAKISD